MEWEGEENAGAVVAAEDADWTNAVETADICGDADAVAVVVGVATVGGGGEDDEVRSFSDDERLDPEAIVTNRSLEGLDAADTNAFVAVVASLGEQIELSFDDEVTAF